MVQFLHLLMPLPLVHDVCRRLFAGSSFALITLFGGALVVMAVSSGGTLVVVVTILSHGMKVGSALDNEEEMVKTVALCLGSDNVPAFIEMQN